jgi:hypothetical protein
VLAQVSYRQKDTVGRPESYFAHLLLAPPEARWSTLECLQRWGAPGWVDEDSDKLAFDLPPMGGLADLLQGHPPIINDAALANFLTAPRQGRADESCGLVPVLWQQREPQQRVRLLVTILARYLEMEISRNEGSLILVAEPGFAALLLYGLARLLPRGHGEFDFSTYEPDVHRQPFRVAATTFHATAPRDSSRAAFRADNVVLDTLDIESFARPTPESAYTCLIHQALSESGLGGADRILDGFDRVTVGCLAELDTLARTHQAAVAIMQAKPLDDCPWKSNDRAWQYLLQLLREMLATADERQLDQLAGSQWHLPLLEWLAGNRAAGEIQGVLTRLARRVPVESCLPFLDSAKVAAEFKTQWLYRTLKHQRRFPAGLEARYLDDKLEGRPWEKGFRAAFARLSYDVMQELEASLRETAWYERFLRVVIAACQARQDSGAALRLLAHVVSSHDAAQLYRFLDAHRELAASPPPWRAARLGDRLDCLLTDLPQDPDHFAEHLDVLCCWRDVFPDGRGPDRLEYWKQVRGQLLQLGERRKTIRAQEYDRLAGELANAALGAMPDDLYLHLPSDERFDYLRKLGAVLIGNPNFPKPYFWRHIEEYFAKPAPRQWEWLRAIAPTYGPVRRRWLKWLWPSARTSQPARKGSKASHEPSKWLVWAFTVLSVLVVLLVIACVCQLLWPRRTPGTTRGKQAMCHAEQPSTAPPNAPNTESPASRTTSKPASGDRVTT